MSTRKYTGVTKHELYKTWETIKRRLVRRASYRDRGITMYEPWRSDPAAFIRDVEAEIGSRPDGRTLDRIDNDGPYAPGNLRWATPAQQQHNRSQRGTTKTSWGKWQAQITREYQRIHIGYFSEEKDAHDAYREAHAAYARGGMTELRAVVGRRRQG